MLKFILDIININKFKEEIYQLKLQKSNIEQNKNDEIKKLNEEHKEKLTNLKEENKQGITDKENQIEQIRNSNKNQIVSLELKRKSHIEEKNNKINELTNHYTEKIVSLKTSYSIEKNKLIEEKKRLQKELDFKLSLREMDAYRLNDFIHKNEITLDELNKDILVKKSNLKQLIDEISNQKETVEDLKAEIGDLESEVDISNYGLYEPHYNFEYSWQYKDKLNEIRREQKEAIKDKTALNYRDNWILNESLAQGQRMNNKNIKSMMRSFNNECTVAIRKVNHSNYSRIEKRINKSFEQHNKINELNDLSIKPEYLKLKIDELHLAFEYALKKEDEKEQLKEERNRQKEEEKLKREVEKQNKRIEKDVDHYGKAIDELQTRLDNEENQSLRDEIKALKEQIEMKNSQKSDMNTKWYNAQAGYVYIISNIGSFGQNIVKIGVTRRLKPEERIKELSSASVPFKFDTHALIFSTDAFALENKLHKRFAANKVNKVNNRKEFFNINIKDIENEIKEYDNVTVDFNEIPEADEYNETLKIENEKSEEDKLKELVEE